DAKVFDAITAEALVNFFPFDPNFTGGVRVAVGDVNRDGVPDIIAAAGPGGGPNVIVYSGKDGSQLLNFYAYDPHFTGGAYMPAGDVNGDGFPDIIAAADIGAGPTVTVLSGKAATPPVGFSPSDTPSPAASRFAPATPTATARPRSSPAPVLAADRTSP